MPRLETFAVRIGRVERQDVARYVVDDLEPHLALAPASVDEVSTCLAAANALGLVVVPWGGGSQMGFGNLPKAYDVALDLTRLDSIVTHQPDDLTAAVQGGVTLEQLDDALGEHGQILPVDAADPAHATIGGLVATGLSGPRRFAYGALRDLIIGVTVVLPDGRVTKGGGMVVKNVSGFDMMRLYHGSLGSLAVVVQVNLKVLPRPSAQRTVVARFAALDTAATAADAIRLSQLAPTAVVVLDEGAAERAGLVGAPWTLLLRCEAPPVSVVRQAERIREAVAGGAATVDVLDETETEPLWLRVAQALSAAQTSAEIGLRVGVAPSGLVDQARAIERAVGEAGLEAAVTLDFGSGIAYARVAAGAAPAARSVWETLAMTGAHASLLTGPAEVKAGTDVFGREPAGMSLMRALKGQFDPQRVLNRGRFAGRL